MDKLDVTHILLAAAALAALFVVPAMAEDVPQPAGGGEPVYVWEGNHIDPQVQAQLTQGVSNLPQPVQAGSVRYITGGIGDEERDALDAVKSQYNLRVTSSNTAGEFDGDTQIVILDRSGGQLLSTTAGPLFYADLPAGTYSIQAINGGRTEQRKVTVGQKPSFVYFRWQS